MSLIFKLSELIDAAEKTCAVSGEDSAEASCAKFAARTFRRSLVLIEPKASEELGVSARALARLMGEIPFEPYRFARQIAPLPGAVDGIVSFLSQPATSSDEREGSGLIGSLAIELEATWAAHKEHGHRSHLSRGDALERMILTTQPRTLADCAVIADIVVRWLRDVDPIESPMSIDCLEALERGFDVLVKALHQIAGRAQPEDRPSFGVLLLAGLGAHHLAAA